MILISDDDRNQFFMVLVAALWLAAQPGRSFCCCRFPFAFCQRAPLSALAWWVRHMNLNVLDRALGFRDAVRLFAHPWERRVLMFQRDHQVPICRGAYGRDEAIIPWSQSTGLRADSDDVARGGSLGLLAGGPWPTSLGVRRPRRPLGDRHSSWGTGPASTLFHAVRDTGLLYDLRPPPLPKPIRRFRRPRRLLTLRGPTGGTSAAEFLALKRNFAREGPSWVLTPIVGPQAISRGLSEATSPVTLFFNSTPKGGSQAPLS